MILIVLNKNPKLETLLKHKHFIDSNITNEYDHITSGELQTMEVKTNRQLRMHELIVDHSSEAALIVMRMPRKLRKRFSSGGKKSPISCLPSLCFVKATASISACHSLCSHVPPSTSSSGSQMDLANSSPSPTVISEEKQV
uniref:SLC12A transporter C-terminal domain-containing protein n=1 Tax=Glossina brevipalpis TaxID=37001 RepID=A0A1A9WNK8_9MUSC